jgi:hypothetical protein
LAAAVEGLAASVVAALAVVVQEEAGRVFHWTFFRTSKAIDLLSICKF